MDLQSDRLFPLDSRQRSIARGIYDEVRDLPIISPHGHVDPNLLLANEQLPEPAQLLIYPDHYVTRLLHTLGVDMAEVSAGADPRASWRLLAKKWRFLRGTAVHYWLTVQLREIFGIDLELGPQTADAIYDQIQAQLQRPEYAPRALFERFRISVLATTDDPVDELSAHAELANCDDLTGTVIPTFRPDVYLEPGAKAWASHVSELGRAADLDCDTYANWVTAMEARREYFRARGAKSTDHSHLSADCAPIATADAKRIYRAALAGEATAAEVAALRGHMVFEMARMSADDGLTMTLHPGVARAHHGPTLERFGPDTGHDIPVQLELTRALQPVLNSFGTAEKFKLVVFTIDETVYSRELAPLAGFYPSVYIGAPWWFLDAPDAILRWRSAITETAGFYKTSGFIDDTRAFISIPVRHDMARRIDANFLSRLVCEHRITEEEAHEIARDLVVEVPQTVFNLNSV